MWCGLREMSSFVHGSDRTPIKESTLMRQILSQVISGSDIEPEGQGRCAHANQKPDSLAKLIAVEREILDELNKMPKA
jgi:hypothetical protein